MACEPLRHFINLVEAAQAPWGVSQSPIFDATLTDHERVFPDLSEKLAKFISVKLPNPLAPTARYGKHDSPMTGPLVGFFHCHLRDDAILIYRLRNRTVFLVAIVAHSEIEGKRAKLTGKKLAPFLNEEISDFGAIKAFLFDKWKERAREQHRPEPADLSGACKFAALFAKSILGGEIVANDFHTWLVSSGEIIDLCSDARDVQEMKDGVFPSYAVSYAEHHGLKVPDNVYTPDTTFMRSADFRNSIRSNIPRVNLWVKEWKNSLEG